MPKELYTLCNALFIVKAHYSRKIQKFSFSLRVVRAISSRGSFLMEESMVTLIETVYNFLWGDLFYLPLPGGGTLPLSILVILLIPTGIYFTIRTKVLPVRLFKDMVAAVIGRKDEKNSALSVLQTLIVSTATRVGMGNLVGVVAAISAGGAGAVFWMWVTAIIGSSTAFIEATLAQLYKEKDPLYGGWRGGPAYYIHKYFEERSGKKRRYVPLSVLFALSGLICWFGISQVVSNSVTSAFENAFHIPPLYTTIVLVILGAVIVLRKNATVRVLDIMVPIMAGIYLLMTIILIIVNIDLLPSVFGRIFLRGIRTSPGSRRRIRRRRDERRQAGTVLQRGRFRFRSVRRCHRGDRSSGKSRSFPGPRRIYRHHINLQLHRHDHAAHSRKNSQRGLKEWICCRLPCSITWENSASSSSP